jgi:DNA-binding CsgD family transcriptional regulator
MRIETPKGFRESAGMNRVTQLTTPKVLAAEPHLGLADLQADAIDYASHIGELRTPDDVLNDLSAITSRHLPLCVLGAVRFSMKAIDWSSLLLGKTVFLHKDVPDGWWEEHIAHAPGRFAPNLFLGRSSLASNTWTEIQHMFQPIGVDRWSFELALKHGMRDGLTCPVGGRWVVLFWSRKVLSRILTQPCRIMICAAANFAALRLEQLVGPDASRFGSFRPRLTSRELAVLRLVSMGRKSAAIAHELGVGEETVRSHLKKAEAKLGVSNRTHAACEALRENLIP